MDGSEVHHTKENKPDFERKKNACFLAYAETTVKLKDDRPENGQGLIRK